ncbi:unnamed protein product [Acanthoscelides obtectus]|uniref:Uncharacterized protein n=1 Tax=Acanthoscelides obtectus TaxID=200917 RepID=A0A9P0KLF9_ACAOB|nr:unnamed protein product [Acanthoscelides obtectus]CAK1631847.1 Dynein assembly factor 5, axonemal [Acanthoscelides obtectus]
MTNEDEDASKEKVVHVKKLCQGLQSLDRKERKQVYVEIEKYLSNPEIQFSNQELRNIFSETHMYILNGLRDRTEAVREQAIKFINFLIINKLSLNDFYLTYLFPVVIERIGTVELIEDSEEIRLQLVQLLDNIITKYSNTEQLKPFLNDCVIILAESVKDKYPAIKELSCRTIVNLATAMPRDFHMQAETLIKPVLTCFNHQRYKVRVEAIYAIGEVIMHSTYKGLDEVVTPMAEKLFDHIPVVRRAVGQVAARWMLEYRDRYSFFHKILPLSLTGLNDEVEETRLEAASLWEKVGMQYQQENEKDLKDELDFLYELPKYYPPDIIRPNPGCRVLVKRNVSKIVPAISKELTCWQEDIRVRCSQLLCAIALHAEEGITQNLQDLLLAMYTAARDDDIRVVSNISRASELLGWFVKYETWSELILPLIEEGPHYGHLTVLHGLVKGSPLEFIQPHVEKVSKYLAEDSICNSRKDKYQLQMANCVRILCTKHTGGIKDNTGYYLFKIIVTLLALRHNENKEKITESLMDDLRDTLKVDSCKDIWSLYTGRLLQNVQKNPESWTPVTDEACIFLTTIELCDEAFGENLEPVSNILEKLLDTEADSEMRLKTFYVLANIFERKCITFEKSPDAAQFLNRLIKEVFVPSLVWRAGASAEAVRAMAVHCLRHALAPPTIGVAEPFAPDELRVIADKLFPLLASLTEDPSYRSRQGALQCAAFLADKCRKADAWMVDDLIAVYSEFLKRLDDPTEKVRITALGNLPMILTDVPEDFKNYTYKAHHEMIIDTLLTHFDDDDPIIQDLVHGALLTTATINKEILLDKIERHKPVLRNVEGCDKIVEELSGMKITEIDH